MLPKSTVMKRFLALSLPFALLVMMLGSCEEADTCKNCHMVTYENGVIISEGSPSTYCGSQLDGVEGQTATVGDRTTVMVCQ